MLTPCPACLSGHGDHTVMWDCEGRGVYGPCRSIFHCRTCRGDE